jgi:hypothetical protein
MSNSSTAIHHNIAVLKMPKKIGDKIIKAQYILSKLTGNANFPTPYPAGTVSLAQLASDITALVNAETAAQTRAAGTAAARDLALAIVMADLRNLLLMVQQKADANVPNSQNIILGAGYDVKKAKTAVKKINGAFNTQVLGTVLVTSDAAGHHEWQMSKDQVAITNLPATSTSHTTVANLTTGDVWYFRNRKVNTKKTTYNWCQWIKLVIGAGGKNTGGGNTPGHAGNVPSNL